MSGRNLRVRSSVLVRSPSGGAGATSARDHMRLTMLSVGRLGWVDYKTLMMWPVST